MFNIFFGGSDIFGSGWTNTRCGCVPLCLGGNPQAVAIDIPDTGNEGCDAYAGTTWILERRNHVGTAFCSYYLERPFGAGVGVCSMELTVDWCLAAGVEDSGLDRSGENGYMPLVQFIIMADFLTPSTCGSATRSCLYEALINPWPIDLHDSLTLTQTQDFWPSPFGGGTDTHPCFPTGHTCTVTGVYE